MKILLDECVPWPMHKLLTGHHCTSVQAQMWSGIKNGELLQRAETEFDLLVTSDQSIRYQQNLAGRRIAILVLSTNDIGRIKNAGLLLQETIEGMKSNELKVLNIP
jgi:predicted nuclease of predicted toxin-antitoxin system